MAVAEWDFDAYQPGTTLAADGEETASVLSWHTHTQQVRATDVRLWSLHLQIVYGSYPIESNQRYKTHHPVAVAT
ncbi:MAG: hypothetical protein ABSH22_20805 [Tepidisphaeraceae bacterium]